MDLFKLLAMAEAKKTLKKAWSDVRFELLTRTIVRLTTAETIESELQKSVDEFLEVQKRSGDDLSQKVSTDIANGVKDEVLKAIKAYDPDAVVKPTSYEFEIPR